jgi:hypothetical protein
MEFKIGDHVISNVNHLLSSEIKKGEKYIINKIQTNRFNEIMYGVEKSYGVFSKKIFELDQMYYRIEKINKIKNGIQIQNKRSGNK